MCGLYSLIHNQSDCHIGWHTANILLLLCDLGHDFVMNFAASSLVMKTLNIEFLSFSYSTVALVQMLYHDNIPAMEIQQGNIYVSEISCSVTHVGLFHFVSFSVETLHFLH